MEGTKEERQKEKIKNEKKKEVGKIFEKNKEIK